MRVVAWILALICALMLLSLFACNPCKRAMKKGCYTRDTLAITDTFTLRDTLVIAGDTVQVAFNPDSLEVEKLSTLLDNAHFMITALRNAQGQVELMVVEKEKKVPFEKVIYRTIKVPVLKATPPPTRWQKIRSIGEHALVFVGLAFIALLLLRVIKIRGGE